MAQDLQSRLSQKKKDSRKCGSTSEKDRDYIVLWVGSQRRINGFIRTLLPWGSDAEDVLQQTSLIAWQKYPTVAAEIAGSPEAFIKWVCAIARFESLKFSRKQNQSGRIVFSDDLIEKLADCQESQSDYLELRDEALADCLKKVSDADCRLLRGRYESGLSVKQISAALGCSASSVYSSLRRVRVGLLRCVMHTLQARGHA